jgi:hypothetical protein
MSSGISIRDFLYLDQEKVRSLAAQIFEGIPEEKTSEKHQEEVLQGEVGTNILFLRGKTAVDLRYFKSENETRSFHHHLYSLVEQQLVKICHVKNIDEKFDFNNWTEKFFRDGEFVKINGYVRLMDVNWLTNWMKNLQKIYRTIQYYELQNISDKTIQMEKKKEQDKNLNDIKNLRLDEMQDVIKQFFGDMVQMKVIPNISHPKNLFVGLGYPENFYEKMPQLTQKYGYDIYADWTVFGQINIPSQSLKTITSFPTGNKIVDAMENVLVALSNVQAIASNVVFPTISITPISVYRSCPMG